MGTEKRGGGETVIIMHCRGEESNFTKKKNAYSNLAIAM